MKIAPSILAADFAYLAADVARVGAEADLLHVDCMDGHYVPNLSIGPPVVKSLRKHTDLFLDCHLMVDNPGGAAGRVRRRGRRRLHGAHRARRPAAVVRRDPRAGCGSAVVRTADSVRRGRAVPRRDRSPARDERAHRLRRPAVHPRGARQGARRAAIDARAARRDRDRRRHQDRQRASRPRPASTSSCRDRDLRRRRPGRGRARSAPPRDDARGQGADRLRRRRGGTRDDRAVARGRRSPPRVRGRRAPVPATASTRWRRAGELADGFAG